MSKPTVAVVFSNFSRAHLLARSLECYERQDWDNGDFELVMVDDHSTDNSIELVKDWGRRTGTRYQIVIPGPKKEDWQDCAHTLNAGIRATTAEYVILTHPEVMPGKRSVAACVDALGRTPWLYASCRPFYLTRRDQERIDAVDWRGKGAIAVREIDGFYDRDQHEGGHPDYAPWIIEQVAQPGFRIKSWDSWVFGGYSRASLKKMGGWIPSRRWGSTDLIQLSRRHVLGIPNYTCPEPDTICCHQNHDDPTKNVPTPRDITTAHQEAAAYSLRPEDCRWPAVNELGWD